MRSIGFDLVTFVCVLALAMYDHSPSCGLTVGRPTAARGETKCPSGCSPSDSDSSASWSVFENTPVRIWQRVALQACLDQRGGVADPCRDSGAYVIITRLHLMSSLTFLGSERFGSCASSFRGLCRQWRGSFLTSLLSWGSRHGRLSFLLLSDICLRGWCYTQRLHRSKKPTRREWIRCNLSLDGWKNTMFYWRRTQSIVKEIFQFIKILFPSLQAAQTQTCI